MKRILRTPQELTAHVIRKRGKLTMTHFARLLGVNRPAAYAYLNGSTPKSDAVLEALGLERAVIVTDASPLKGEE